MKKAINWPKTVLICTTFESLQCSIKCFFLPIKKAAVMICFLLLQSTYKNFILYYKADKFTINASNFAKVFFDVIVYHHNLLSFIIINSGFLYSFEIYYCYASFTLFYLYTLSKFIVAMLFSRYLMQLFYHILFEN